MEVIYPLLNVVLIGGLVYRLGRRLPGRFWQTIFWPALLFKVGCGTLVGLLYRYYFSGGDTFAYQQQADILCRYAQQNSTEYLQFILTGRYHNVYLQEVMRFPTYSNSFFMVWVLHVVNFITGGNYYVNAVYFSLFSFWGTWRLTQTLAALFPVTRLAATVAFLFFPSVVFWSSGILKESILLGSGSLLLAALLNLVYRPEQSRWREGLLLVLAGYICFKIRYYFAVAYLPLLGSWALTEKMARRWALKKWHHQWLLYCGGLGILGTAASFLHEALHVDFLLYELTRNYQSLRAKSLLKAYIDYPDLQPNFGSILYYTPKAVGSAIFRPFVWEATAIPYFVAGLENLVLLILVLVALASYRKVKPTLPSTLVLALLLYGLVVAALIGISTPNLGSLSRYKIAFLPFLLYLVLQTGQNQLTLQNIGLRLTRRRPKT